MVAHIFHGVLTGSYRYTTLTDVTNGGHIFCDRNDDFFNCGGATGLDFPPGSNAVSFYRGAEDGHGTGDMGEFQAQAQAQGAGRGVFFPRA